MMNESRTSKNDKETVSLMMTEFQEHETPRTRIYKLIGRESKRSSESSCIVDSQSLRARLTRLYLHSMISLVFIFGSKGEKNGIKGSSVSFDGSLNIVKCTYRGEVFFFLTQNK